MKNLLLMLLCGTVLAALTGCGADQTADTDAAGTQTESSTATGTEPVAFRNSKGELVCPMMKTVLASEDEAHDHVDIDGVRYYTCCAPCTDKAKSDPEAFKKMAAEVK